MFLMVCFHVLLPPLGWHMQVHQATAIMKWSNNDYSGMDAFDRMDLAVSVTKSVCVSERSGRVFTLYAKE